MVRLTLVGLGLAGAALAALGVVALADGGAPTRPFGEGGTSHGPSLESWTLATTDGRIICGHDDLCPLPATRAAGTCQWRGTVWLSSRAVPVVLRDVTGEGWALLVFGSGQPTGPGRWDVHDEDTYFPAPGPHGWWWKAQAMRVPLALPAPCDLVGITVSLNYAGTTLTGERATFAQVVRTNL